MTEPAPDAIKAATALTGALESMSGELAQLNAYGRRNRKLIHWLIASLAFDVLLTIGLGFATVQSQYASAAAQHASASAVKARQLARVAAQENTALCLSGNKARAQQIQLWDYVIGLNRQPRTPAKRRAIAAFEAHLRKVFQPRDCEHVSPGHL